MIGETIKCYQCASTEDQQKITGIWSKDKFSQDRFEDRCGVYWPFQKERNTPVECNSDESHTPGDGRVGGEGVESSVSKRSIRRFVITDLLLVESGYYAKRALTPRSLNMKLGP